jgi:ankyrin repeat protein
MSNAARGGNVAVMEILLRFGANVHGLGMIPPVYESHQDAMWYSDDMVRNVSESVEEEPDPFETPLLLAVLNGHVPAAQFLLDHGAVVTSHMLVTAVQDGNQEMLEVLLRGKEVEELMAEDEGEVTLLHWAAMNGHEEVAKVLVSLGQKIDARSGDGMTPLHFACYGGHVKVVQFFIDHGCKVDEKMDDGKTPLDCATEKGHLEVVNLLVKGVHN